MEEKAKTTEEKAVKTTASDVGIKLLDIIAKPINMICNYIEEPLKIVESARKNNDNEDRQAIKNEIMKAEELSRLQQKNLKAQQEYEKAQMKIKKEMAETEAAIDTYKNEAKMKNQKELVEAITNYHRELSQMYVNMAESIDKSSSDALSEITQLQVNLNKQVIELTKNAKGDYNKNLRIIKKEFGDDKETFNKLLDDLRNEQSMLISQITEMMTTLNKQVDRINQLSAEQAKDGRQTVKDFLIPIIGASAYNLLSSNTVTSLDTSESKSEMIEAKAEIVE